jgi:hypothetical protein
MKITNNASLKAYIERQIPDRETIIEKKTRRKEMNKLIAGVTGLSTATIAGAVREKKERLSARNYALIQAAIDEGRLPA